MDPVPSETMCFSRQHDVSVREEIGQGASMASRLGIGPPGEAPAAEMVRRSCPNVTGVACPVDSSPVMITSSHISAGASASSRCHY